jgi:hypothetical protein
MLWTGIPQVHAAWAAVALVLPYRMADPAYRALPIRGICHLMKLQWYRACSTLVSSGYHSTAFFLLV